MLLVPKATASASTSPLRRARITPASLAAAREESDEEDRPLRKQEEEPEEASAAQSSAPKSDPPDSLYGSRYYAFLAHARHHLYSYQDVASAEDKIEVTEQRAHDEKPPASSQAPKSFSSLAELPHADTGEAEIESGRIYLPKVVIL